MNVGNHNTLPRETIKIAGEDVNVIVDSGAEVNVLCKDTMRQLPNVKLKPSTLKVFPYGARRLFKLLGNFIASV